MTYAVGQRIEEADYTAFRGTLGPSAAYPDATSATRKLAALIGVGYRNRGYGQTSFLMPSVAVGDVILADHWNGIFNALGIINTHTGSGLTIPSQVVANTSILAQDGSAGRSNLGSLISTLDSNRLTYSVGQMGLTSALTSTRTTAWNVQVYHEFTVTFTNEDQARYFFNTGGQIYASASRSGGTASSLNSVLTTILSNMGTIKFGQDITTYTGTGGTAYPIGYYDLTSSYQTVFVAYGTTIGYTSLSYLLKARAEGIVGANGGNGSTIRFQAVISTGLPSYDTLNGTLTSTISQLKAGGVLSITSPTYSTTTGL